MIVKVKLKDKHTNEIFFMLFGTSYKTWLEQFREYERLHKDSVEVLEFFKSKEKWVGWGGLKWCSEKTFQDVLDREGMQKDEGINPNARQYSKMLFTRF